MNLQVGRGGCCISQEYTHRFRDLFAIYMDCTPMRTLTTRPTTINRYEVGTKQGSYTTLIQ